MRLSDGDKILAAGVVMALAAILLSSGRVDAIPATHRLVATGNPVVGMGLWADPITISPSLCQGVITTSTGGTLTTTPRLQAGAFTWTSGASAITVTPTYAMVDTGYVVKLEPLDVTSAALAHYISSRTTPTFTASSTSAAAGDCCMSWEAVDY